MSEYNFALSLKTCSYLLAFLIELDGNIFSMFNIIIYSQRSYMLI